VSYLRFRLAQVISGTTLSRICARVMLPYIIALAEQGDRVRLEG
jgi:hypothetical protein